MTYPNRRLLGLFLLAVLALLGGLSLLKGGFYVGKHEDDTLHLVELILRLASGDRPHLDFQTPIGALAIAPIALFVRLGLGVGQAILAAQVLVAVLALPAVWWVAARRFHGGWAYLFGGFTLALILALVHGETEQSVSISMHYNRWAWAAAYLAIATALLPDRVMARPIVDGLVIGAALSVLALVKVTFFAAFVLPIAVALIGRRAWRVLLVAGLTGLAAVVLTTLLVGTPAYWLAYLRDLATVAASEVRPRPGLRFADVVAAPAYLGGSLLLLAAVVFLRQAGRSLEGLVLLLLVPGFFYVTYQNFGNDPQWLGLFALLIVMLAPGAPSHNAAGWDLGKALRLTAAASFAFATPSALNLAYSPVRHFGSAPEAFAPLVPGNPALADLFAYKSRNLRVVAQIPIDGPDTPYAPFVDAELTEKPLQWQGESWPACEAKTGSIAGFVAISEDLKASGLTAGKHVFVADVLASFWLHGAFAPLPHGSPWYYGGLPGIDAADYLLVPTCPISGKVRALVLEAVEASGATLTEVRRNALFVLYAL